MSKKQEIEFKEKPFKRSFVVALTRWAHTHRPETHTKKSDFIEDDGQKEEEDVGKGNKSGSLTFRYNVQLLFDCNPSIPWCLRVRMDGRPEKVHHHRPPPAISFLEFRDVKSEIDCDRRLPSGFINTVEAA